MKSKAKIAVVSAIATLCLSSNGYSGDTHTNDYGPYPVTLQGYTGSKTNSVSYTGQIGRQVLHTSIKKLSSQGNGGANAGRIKAEMMSYFGGTDKNKKILSPVDKGSFNIKQETMREISKTNLAGKASKGVVNGWPGQMTGRETLEFMIDKAASTNKGFDPITGYDYIQLISKFTMGAVFYHQACDNYLDEKMGADNKPNNKPYKEGKHYTGKEHSWDEAFGYFGAAAHTLKLSPEQSYNVSKMKDLAAADANGDGLVDLLTEMTFAHAYYASAFDKGGKTNYLETITRAFVDGRQLIADAKGEALTDAERGRLVNFAGVICSNWEKVIAEAVFKYAGSVYNDISKLEELMASSSDTKKAFRTYAKHWGELKGFAMSLQTGKYNLGETGTKLNRMIGMGPLLMNASQVSGVNSKGEYLKDEGSGWGEYKLHMLKVQKLMIDAFQVKARNKDKLSDMSNLAEKLGGTNSSEND